MELTTIGTLKLMPENKQEQERFVELAKQEILNGNYKAVELLYHKKMIEDTLNKIFDAKEIKNLMIEEVEKFGKEGALFNTAKIEVSSKRSYDYSHTNDSEWIELNSKIENLVQEKKAREKFLQILSKPVANIDSGELIYPAAVAYTTYLKVTIK